MPSLRMQGVIDSLERRQAARAAGPPRTLDEVRASYTPVGQLMPLPDDITVTGVDANGVPAHWLDQPGGERDKVLLFLHGGGYSLGSLRSHGPLAARLLHATGTRVLFVEYRLAPQHPFPAAVDDVLAAWDWLVAQDGVDASSVPAAGDSAGGGLTLALLHTVRDRRQAMPAGAVLISPWIDLTCSGSSMIDRAARDPIFSRERVQRKAAEYLAGAAPTNRPPLRYSIRMSDFRHC